MTRLPTLVLAFATGFLTALTGAWWTAETLLRLAITRGKVRR